MGWFGAGVAPGSAAAAAMNTSIVGKAATGAASGVMVLKTGFLIFGALCSKLFGMGLIGFMAFQSLTAPRSDLPPLRPPPIDLSRSVAFYRRQQNQQQQQQLQQRQHQQ